MGAALDKALGESLTAMTDVAPADLVPVYDADGATTKSATVTELLNALNGLTDIVGATDPAADFLLLFDASAAEVKKVTPDSIGVGGGLVFLQTADITSQSTVDIEVFDDTLYDGYLITFANINQTILGGSYLYMETGDVGAYDTGASDYSRSSIVGTNGTITGSYSAATDEIAMSGTAIKTAGAPGISGWAQVMFPQLAKPTSVVFHTYTETASGLVTHVGGGFRKEDAEVTRVRIGMNSATMTSGSISVYGIVKG